MPELNDDELSAIGRIALRDAGLNQLLEYMLWLLIDPDDNIGATITKGWNFARVLETLKALARLRIKEEHLQKLVLDWIGKAHWAHKERNSIIHSALVRMNPDDDRLTRFRIVPGEEEAMVEIESFKAASLDYLAGAMDDIASEGIELYGLLGGPKNLP